MRGRMASGEWRIETPIRYSLFAIRSFLRLAGRFLAGLVDLHLGVGLHQAALVRQRHELEAHVDRAHRAVRARTVDPRMQTALAALLDDLLVDLEDFRLVAIELRHQAVGEAEI